MAGSQTGGQAVDVAIERAQDRFAARPRIAFAGFGAPGRTTLFHAMFGGGYARTEVRHPGSGLVADFTVAPAREGQVPTLEAFLALLSREHAVVHVIDAEAGPVRGDAVLHDALAGIRGRTLTVVQKADLLDEEDRARLLAGLRETVGTDDVVWVSSRTGEGLPELARRLAEVLPGAAQDAFLSIQEPGAALRRRRARRLVQAKAALCGALALGGSPEEEIEAVQAALVAVLARLHGVDASPDRVRELVDTLGIGTGIAEVGRRLFRWVPGGRPGAAATFANTVALGEAATRWAQSRMRAPEEELREVYRHALARARSEWPVFASRSRRLLAKLEDLRARLEAGDVAGPDYDEELARLGEVDDRRVQLASD